MGFYNDHVAPVLVNFACGSAAIREERLKALPEAEGVVLEIGAGGGRNFPLYDQTRIARLYALEPSPAMRRLARKRAEAFGPPLEWLSLEAEQIPLAENSIDTVVLTFTLCTIGDAERALSGMKRVLRPGGKLVFLEHGAAPDPKVRLLQERLNPLWGALGGGCRLTREPAVLIRDAGFKTAHLESYYAQGSPRFAGYLSRGVAFA
jgi:ubiquinone/menaquinone biosynthesis C-methylase UbiE